MARRLYFQLPPPRVVAGVERSLTRPAKTTVALVAQAAVLAALIVVVQGLPALAYRVKVMPVATQSPFPRFKAVAAVVVLVQSVEMAQAQHRALVALACRRQLLAHLLREQVAAEVAQMAGPPALAAQAVVVLAEVGRRVTAVRRTRAVAVAGQIRQQPMSAATAGQALSLFVTRSRRTNGVFRSD